MSAAYILSFYDVCTISVPLERQRSGVGRRHTCALCNARLLFRQSTLFDCSQKMLRGEFDRPFLRGSIAIVVRDVKGDADKYSLALCVPDRKRWSESRC